MSKNVNSDISKDLPMERLPAIQEVIVSNPVGDSKIFFAEQFVVKPAVWQFNIMIISIELLAKERDESK